jgi:hypothetical protein
MPSKRDGHEFEESYGRRDSDLDFGPSPSWKTEKIIGFFS